MFRFISKIISKIKNFLKNPSDNFLCDSCAYDYPSACSHPERPNVKECGEYKLRGNNY
ncbi:MAG: hypothetical protein V1752_05030 [Candidatus Firestonebacteria bacterium]